MLRKAESRRTRTPVASRISRYFQQQLPAGTRIILLTVLMLACLGAYTSCLATVAGTVDATYNFGANNFFVDPFQPYVYATSGNSLKVINSSTLAVVHSIPLPAVSYGMTMSPDGNKLFIAGGSSQSIFVLDTHTWTLLPSLSVSGNPFDLAMGLNNRLFVLGAGISQIDATTGESTGPIAPVGTYSGALRISPDRQTLFYANFGLSPGTLYKLDVSTTKPVVVWQNPVDIGENGEQLALSHNGSMVAYVCGYGYYGYQIPNFRTFDMSLLGVFPTGAYPNAVAYSPDDRYAYALHWIYPTAVDIYDTSTYAMVGQFAIAGRSSVVATDQTGQHLFVAFGQVLVYDTGRTVITNQPPICHIGGPYTVECQGAATVVQLDGSASSDPAGQPLTFMWSADCPGMSFDDPSSSTPKLTIDALAAQSCTVTLVVSDGQLTNSAQTTVTLTDGTPPMINCASNKVVECGSGWDFDTPVALDACCGTNVSITVVGTVTNTLANDCSVAITRTWQAADCSGNTNTCSQTVMVVDTTPPIINCPSNKVVECGSTWNFDTPDAFDACSGANVTLTVLGTATNASGNDCSLDITRTWQAVDCSGNTNTCSQTVTVVNTTPPDLSQISVSPATLWPPNHKLVPVTIRGAVIDGCNSVASCQIVSVTINDSGIGEGAKKGPDYQITGDRTVLLRAERNDAHAGRTYQILVEAEDTCGNTATRVLLVTVPGSGN